MSQDPKKDNDSTNEIDLSFLEEDGSPNPTQKESKETKPGTTPEFKIHPKFSNLPEKEGLIRTAQSAMTVLSQEVNRLHSVVEESQKYKHLFEQIESDPKLRKAYFKKLEPELFKSSVNVEERVKAKLMEEFKDFEPNASEAGIYGSATYKYNRRAAELEKEFSAGTEEIPELEDILKNKKADRESKLSKVQTEIADVKQKYNWDDTSVENMFAFFKGLKVTDMARIFHFVTKKAGYKDPASTKGNKPTTGNVEKYINDMLGAPVSGPEAWNRNK